MLELTPADVSRLPSVFRGRTASLAGILLGCDVVDARHTRVGRVVALLVDRGEIVALRVDPDGNFGPMLEVRLDDVAEVEPGRIVLAADLEDLAPS
ncbi:MAG TPA: hypothetical protein VM889_07935 [Candidatus Thermoplasmatota archaeon]|nr:hypothetical protein [Candidatus Thermoplasmatota archaeon]